MEWWIERVGEQVGGTEWACIVDRTVGEAECMKTMNGTGIMDGMWGAETYVRRSKDE